MEGRNPEFAPVENELTDNGFSEKRAARLVEGVKQDNSQVKKRKPVSLSPTRKIRFPGVLRKRSSSPKKVVSRRDKI